MVSNALINYGHTFIVYFLLKIMVQTLSEIGNN